MFILMFLLVLTPPTAAVVVHEFDSPPAIEQPVTKE